MSSPPVHNPRLALTIYQVLRDYNPHLPPPEKVAHGSITLTTGRDMIATLTLDVMIDATPEMLSALVNARLDSGASGHDEGLPALA